MDLSKSIADRLRTLFLEGTWIANTNYKTILLDVDRELALTRVGQLNSIAMLTFHVNYYLGGLLPVFDGGPLEIRDKYSFDLPEILTEADWQKLKDELLSNAEKFIAAVEALSEEQLYAPFVMEQYGNYLRNIEGVIEHSYYHLGQISLLKKQIG